MGQAAAPAEECVVAGRWRRTLLDATVVSTGILSILVLLLVEMGAAVLAQDPATPPPDQAPTQTLPLQQQDKLSCAHSALLDPLLGQVLVACTYPLELVEAQQWLQANRNLNGQQLMDAARQQNWDASVQALVAVPEVVASLIQDIRWTDLGNAFLAQQSDVMRAVQRMRARAQANGKLQSTTQETVDHFQADRADGDRNSTGRSPGDLRPGL